MPDSSYSITHQNQVSSYQRLARRISREIADAQYRCAYRVTVYPNADDNPEDWDQIINDLLQAERARVSMLPCGAVDISWPQPPH